MGAEVERESVKRGAVDFSDLTARIAKGNPDFVGFAGLGPSRDRRVTFDHPPAIWTARTTTMAARQIR